MINPKFVALVKNPVVFLSVCLAICLGVIIWQFGVKVILSSQYQKGVIAGQNNVNSALIQGLVQNGKIGVNVPLNDKGQFDPNGTIRQIILVPQAQ